MNLNENVTIQGIQIPSFRTMHAIENKVEKNLLLHTWGGLGDQVCSEPTLRYAINTFKNCDISLSSQFPDLFSHLKFKQSFHVDKEKIEWDKYLVFQMILPPPHLAWEFYSHALVNCVDYPALNCFRMQLAVKDREILLTGSKPSQDVNGIFIHPGKHWQSKTFPSTWWESVIDTLVDAGQVPIIIGADVEQGRRGTVDIDNSGCVDLRNKLTISQTTYLLQRAKVLLTNDSAPLHLAASRDPQDLSTGKCWIGYIATCKHPDYITHWRHGQWQYREVNHSSGGLWEILNNCPNQHEEVMMHKADQKQLESWLPDPKKYAEWALEKAHEQD